ncbi:hypothetical protein PJP10_03130 [Mycobacterium kansasii]
MAPPKSVADASTLSAAPLSARHVPGPTVYSAPAPWAGIASLGRPDAFGPDAVASTDSPRRPYAVVMAR